MLIYIDLAVQNLNLRQGCFGIYLQIVNTTNFVSFHITSVSFCGKFASNVKLPSIKHFIKLTTGVSSGISRWNLNMTSLIITAPSPSSLLRVPAVPCDITHTISTEHPSAAPNPSAIHLLR